MRAGIAVIRIFCGVLATSVCSAQESPVARASFHEVTEARSLPNGFEVHDGPLVMRVTALRDDVVRIRAGRGKLPEDASWAVLSGSRTSSVSVAAVEDAVRVGFASKALRVEVNRKTGILTIRDVAGNPVLQDAEPLVFDGERVVVARVEAVDEHYFGLGDKTGPLDRRGETFRLWNTDAYAWQESTDPLYKSIPFYISYRAGMSVGVLMDNTWPSTFDFGKTQDGVMRYEAEGAFVDEYVMYGPSAKQVLGAYAWLTGPTPLPPMWALGFQQSRYSYMTQARVLEVAGQLRADRIPADAIYLDIDYQQKNRPFSVDVTAFPDMAGMVSALHKERMHVVAITDLHISDLPGQDYAPFESGMKGNHFVRNPDGSLYVGPVWPGPSVFPDFTQAETRRWWGSLYRKLVDLGVDGFWNDMNEPSVFTPHLTIPDATVHRIDEPGFVKRIATHREVHNVYGQENVRATFEGQLTLRPDVRPFVLTRASYAGGQRYAATWTGDNSATWNHLRLTTPMLKNLGLSGFSLSGADVGGYAGTPSADLLTKWIEIAAFQPIDRDHAEKGTGNHEVWANGPEHEETRRKFIEERYKLLPYLYTVMEEGTRSGLPLLRPLFLEFPGAASDNHPMDVDADTAAEFMVGTDLLVAPAPFPDKTDDYDAKLPSAEWYDYWSGQSVGVATAVKVHPELEKLPVFVRPGTILPIQPVVQSTQDKPAGPLTLRVFPGEECGGSLYQDDGTSFAYRRGEFLRMEFSCRREGEALRIHVGKHEGTYPPWWSRISIEVNGDKRPVTSVTVNGQPATYAYGYGHLIVDVADDGKGFEILVR